MYNGKNKKTSFILYVVVILIGGEVNQPVETIFDKKKLRPPLVGSTD
jgi:hypothetical protein